ncbi:MAG: hypothetical protein H0X29_11870, partial [Parachlamydiaceae bacterium]|nr:hypothetical protein [Parachlamydiaceae bacterium]
LQGRPIPPVQFIETDGTMSAFEDQPGPRRNLVTRLMNSFVLKAGEDQTPFIKDEFGRLTPVIPANARGLENYRKGFQTLGAIFLQSIREGFLTGNVFNPSLFKMMGSLSYQDVAGSPNDPADLPDHIRLKLMLAGSELPFKDILLQKQQSSDLNDSEYNILRDNIINILDENERTPDLSKVSLENKKWIYERALKYCKELQQEQRQVQGDMQLPAFLIAKQFQLQTRATQEQWPFGGTLPQQIKATEALQAEIEGSLTKDLFKSTIKWELSEGLAEKNVENENKVKHIQTLINQFVEESSLDDLAKLTFAITGSKTMRGNTALKFQLFNREKERLPAAHTCFSIIEISANCPDYETFKKVMTTFIEHSTQKDHSGLFN